MFRRFGVKKKKTYWTLVRRLHYIHFLFVCFCFYVSTVWCIKTMFTIREEFTVPPFFFVFVGMFRRRLRFLHCFLCLDGVLYKTIFTVSGALQRVVLYPLLPARSPGPQVSDSTRWRFQSIDFCQRSGISLRELWLWFVQILCQTQTSLSPTPIFARCGMATPQDLL